MFVHVVLFDFRDRAVADEAVTRLRDLAGAVPQIRSLEAGVNVVDSVRAFEVGLVVRFESQADMEAYQVHPDHQVVAGWIRERVTSAASADFVG